MRTYSYSQLVQMSLNFGTELVSTALFILVFVLLHTNRMSLNQLVVISHLLALLAYVLWVQIGIRRHESHFFRLRGKQTAKSGIILLLVLLLCSPILKTLTADISTDSIWRTSLLTSLIHLCFFDYLYQRVGTMSLNAGFLGAVVLASRLSTAAHVYGFLMLAVHWFALWPLLRGFLKTLHSDFVEVTLFLLFSLLAAMISFSLSSLLLLILLAGLFFVTLLAPAWFKSLQSLKNTIHGPWDEAIPYSFSD